MAPLKQVVEKRLTFDETIRRVLNVPPPPSGKKAKRASAAKPTKQRSGKAQLKFKKQKEPKTK